MYVHKKSTSHHFETIPLTQPSKNINIPPEPVLYAQTLRLHLDRYQFQMKRFDSYYSMRFDTNYLIVTNRFKALAWWFDMTKQYERFEIVYVRIAIEQEHQYLSIYIYIL